MFRHAAAITTGSRLAPQLPGSASNRPGQISPHPAQRPPRSRAHAVMVYQSRPMSHAPHSHDNRCSGQPRHARSQYRRSATPSLARSAQARFRLKSGVCGTSSIFQSGWKAVKCSGTSGPSCFATHSQSAPISSDKSFLPGISKVVISSQVLVSCLTSTSVSRTASSKFRAKLLVEALGERLEIDIGGVHRGEELS